MGINKQVKEGEEES